MKEPEAEFALCLALLWPGILNAAVPYQMNFQGRIELPVAEIEGEGGRGNKEASESIPFNGTGRFKFAIVSSTGGIFWTNVANEFSVPPSASVSIPVDNGVFNVALGDPALNMPPIRPEIFSGADRYLRVFFQGETTKGNKTKLTAERELLPPQKLLTVPFAFQSAVAQQAVDKETLQVLLAGATVQGTFAIAQNAVILGSATVKGNVIVTGAIRGTQTYDLFDNHLAFNEGPAGIFTTPLLPFPVTPATGALAYPIAGGAALNLEAAGGLFLNQIATGPVSIAAGGGSVLISTPPGSGNVGIGTANPAFKLHISSGAGEPGDILVVSTGASNIFRVNGRGEVSANKYYGDGSALTGLAAGGVPAAISVSTINAAPATPFGGVNITTSVFISRGSLSIGTVTATEALHVAGTAKFDGAIKIGDNHLLGLYPDELQQFWWQLPAPSTSVVLYAKPTYNSWNDGIGNVIYLAPSGVPSGSSYTQDIYFAGTDPVDPVTGKITSKFSGTFLETYFAPSVTPVLSGSLIGVSDFETWNQAYSLRTASDNGFWYYSWDATHSTQFHAGPSDFSYNGAYVYGGSHSGGFGYDVAGKRFWADGTKSFIQDYPGDPSRTISYYSLEGPEAGIYVRGTAKLSGGKAKVILPDYFTVVASTAFQATVQVTPRGDCQGLYVFRQANGEIDIRELGGGKSDAEFDYFVQTVRKGYENIPVVQNKDAAPESYKTMKMPPNEMKNRIRTGGKRGKLK